MLAGAVRAGNEVMSGLKIKSATQGRRQRRKKSCRSIFACCGEIDGASAEEPREARYAASVSVGAGRTWVMVVGVARSVERRGVAEDVA